MKRIFAFFTVLALVLSLGAAAFAEIHVIDLDGHETNPASPATVTGDQKSVYAEPGDSLTVLDGNLSVGNYDTAVNTDGGEISVVGDPDAGKGNVSAGNNGAAAVACDGTISVSGNASAGDGKDAYAVYAEDGSTITIGGNASVGNAGTAVYADDSEVTVTGNASAGDNGGKAVHAVNGSTVTINGNASGEEWTGYAEQQGTVYADSGSTITVNGDVDGRDNGTGARANDGSTVTVHGSAHSEYGEAASADNGSTVTVDGDAYATGNDGGRGAFAANGSTVTVGGDAYGCEAAAVWGGTVIVNGDAYSTADEWPAVSAFEEGTVIIVGSVSAGNGNETYAVYAEDGSTITIGGGVTVGNEGTAVTAITGGTVFIEGEVQGNIQNLNSYFTGSDESGEIYLGKLTGEISDISDKDKIHYLISLADGSKQPGTDFSYEDNAVFDYDKTITGVKNEEGIAKEYYFTKSADFSSSVSVTLKPTDSSKQLKVSGNLPAGVTVNEKNGSLTLTLGNNFTGGLQSLMLILENIAHDTPVVAVMPTVYVNDSSVIQTISVELPSGAEEGAVMALDITNHAGFTVAGSLLDAKTEYHPVQMFLDDEPVSEDHFTLITHRDGSLSVILSNTYLFSLGSGTYNFRALVEGQEICFSVLVEK